MDTPKGTSNTTEHLSQLMLSFGKADASWVNLAITILMSVTQDSAQSRKFCRALRRLRDEIELACPGG